MEGGHALHDPAVRVADRGGGDLEHHHRAVGLAVAQHHPVRAVATAHRAHQRQVLRGAALALVVDGAVRQAVARRSPVGQVVAHEVLGLRIAEADLAGGRIGHHDADRGLLQDRTQARGVALGLDGGHALEAAVEQGRHAGQEQHEHHRRGHGRAHQERVAAAGQSDLARLQVERRRRRGLSRQGAEGEHHGRRQPPPQRPAGLAEGHGRRQGEKRDQQADGHGPEVVADDHRVLHGGQADIVDDGGGHAHDGAAEGPVQQVAPAPAEHHEAHARAAHGQGQGEGQDRAVQPAGTAEVEAQEPDGRHGPQAEAQPHGGGGLPGDARAAHVGVHPPEQVRRRPGAEQGHEAGHDHEQGRRQMHQTSLLMGPPAQGPGSRPSRSRSRRMNPPAGRAAKPRRMRHSGHNLHCSATSPFPRRGFVVLLIFVFLAGLRGAGQRRSRCEGETG